MNGIVTINAPDVDPSQGLVELPQSVVDPSQEIAQKPCEHGVDSNFVVTGRGGLPPSPYEPLSTDVIWSDTRERAITAWKERSHIPTPKPPTQTHVIPIVPATGWVVNDKGEVILISHVYNATSWLSTPAICSKKMGNGEWGMGSR